MNLPTKPSHKNTSLQGKVFVIHGAPKIGKTTLATMFPKPFFIATEKGHDAFSIFVKQIKSWKGFIDIIKALMTQKHDYKTIVIDTFGNIVDWCQIAVSGEKGVSHPAEGDYGIVWDAFKSELKQQMYKLLAYCADNKISVVFICHTKQVTIMRATKQTTKEVIDCKKQGTDVLFPIADFIMAIVNEDVAGDKGTAETKRMIYTRGCEYIEAGSRFPDALPQSFEFSWKPFEKGFRK